MLSIGAAIPAVLAVPIGPQPELPDELLQIQRQAGQVFERLIGLLRAGGVYGGNFRDLVEIRVDAFGGGGLLGALVGKSKTAKPIRVG